MIRRSVLALAVIVAASGMSVAVAEASTAPPAGRVNTAVQNMFEHRLAITGWAYDPAKGTAPITVAFWADGHYLGSTRANKPSPVANATYHLRGDHRYSLTVTWKTTAKRVTAKTRGVRTSGPMTMLATRTVTHYYPSAGARIISVAKRYVGKARYVEGGASPSGFDCSGYTRYAYQQANVKTLTHNAEAQRRAMRRISASSARPGDLVFYLSGGSAYHVAIYAGRGMQYAAATVRDGIRYQHVWSSAVQYGTVTH